MRSTKKQGTSHREWVEHGKIGSCMATLWSQGHLTLWEQKHVGVSQVHQVLRMCVTCHHTNTHKLTHSIYKAWTGKPKLTGKTCLQSTMMLPSLPQAAIQSQPEVCIRLIAQLPIRDMSQVT